MVRILVVGDDALLRSLEGRFGPGIDVVGTRSVSQTVVQALVERPSLIICSQLGLEGPLEELWGGLQKVGLESTPVLCVGDDPHSSGESRPGIEFCDEETLLEAAAVLLPAPRAKPARRQVQLLASMQRIPWDAAENDQNLANVLELDAETVLVESPIRLEPGQRLALSFFLPRRGCGPSERVSLACQVTGVCDDMALQYEAEVDFADEPSARALAEFLSQSLEASEER